MEKINGVLQLTKEEHETLIECLAPDIQPNQKFKTTIYIHIINGVVKVHGVGKMKNSVRNKLYHIFKKLSAIDLDGDVITVILDTIDNRTRSTILYGSLFRIAEYECNVEQVSNLNLVKVNPLHTYALIGYFKDRPEKKVRPVCEVLIDIGLVVPNINAAIITKVQLIHAIEIHKGSKVELTKIEYDNVMDWFELYQKTSQKYFEKCHA